MTAVLAHSVLFKGPRNDVCLYDNTFQVPEIQTERVLGTRPASLSAL